MAGNVQQQQDAPHGVTGADIWAALESMDPSVRGEEASTQASAEAEEPAEDIGHGAEVRAQAAEEDSASGENAGDEDAAEQAAETGQEEEAAEEDSAAEEDTGQEPEEGESDAAPEPPKGIREMEKRIDKLTARSKGLEEENATLKSQLEKAQPVTLQPSGADPAANLNSRQEVDDAVKAMRDHQDWCMENFDGGEMTQPDGSVKYFDAREVRQHYRNCEKFVNFHAPERLKYLERKERAETVCKQIYPELFDSKSQECQAAWMFIRANPEILRLPHYALIIGDALRGGRLRVEEQKAKQARNGAAPRAVAPSPGSAGPKLAPRAISPAAAKSIRSNGAAQLHQRFMKTGSKRDLEAYWEKALGG